MSAPINSFFQAPGQRIYQSSGGGSNSHGHGGFGGFGQNQNFLSSSHSIVPASRRADDDEDPPCVTIDPVLCREWIYPVNREVRKYQMTIAKNALLHNTLVVLPTGLGKTLIAAVVMYNYYRWFPHGKVVFMAPTKPLVAQQIEACHGIMGSKCRALRAAASCLVEPSRLCTLSVHPDTVSIRTSATMSLPRPDPPRPHRALSRSGAHSRASGFSQA